MNSTSGSFARPGENPAGRQLDWNGCFHARDLGGIPIASGGETRWGAVVRRRAERRRRVGAAAHGARTVIDLRNEDERSLDSARRPAGIDTLHLPLDAIDDSDFWEDWMHGPPVRDAALGPVTSRSASRTRARSSTTS